MSVGRFLSVWFLSVRVACFGGDRDACQWPEHLGVELRGVPVDAGDDALGGDDFARDVGFAIRFFR